ncbi:probable LRR receptor-like serine/threonine-protein kinase RKF3 [Magnolia sinica]|uniref:probable LRR receptor-like serine/threonine-protein kinase RKF3 n=1 Tax=Magnolia sinica TaxID=86752 RepID=UPI002659BB67|nr:probable LRR receptor-like serine/threonine-protein kinase RKF3 [Magnolia sinica]
MSFSKITSNVFFAFAVFLSLLLLVLAFFQSNNGVSSFRNRRLASSSDCPMNFSVLRKFLDTSQNGRTANVSLDCQYALQGIHLVQAEYLRTDGLFVPPLSTAESCWDSYQDLVKDFISDFDVRSVCGFETSWIAQGCMNITTRSQFESLVPESSLQDVRRACNQSLLNNSPCASCTTSLSRLKASYLTGPDVGNVSDCSAYPFIYAAGSVNSFGPTDGGTAVCLFLLQSSSSSSGGKGKKGLVFGVVVGCVVGLSVAVLGVWFLWRKRCGKWRMRKKKSVQVEMSSISGLDSIGASTTLVRFTFEEVKAATRNFSRDNIIGKGGYGNVYRGILSNGSEVALKRFKNCSAAGDANFSHEVEVIASVRHVNLVALRGYCTATTSFEGHQRIIVCDLMCNGSLYDHLFGSSDEKKLSWPIRQKIAIGTARGLAYLHYGAQPAIIHRDIKASNILLDENFEAKVADFGLAKFTPEGMTHLSTRVAGTLGYVAPEYALYGQLTERSDVYSFGVVLLEILSGKKALISMTESQTWLVTDWAWSLVRKGRALDVIEEGMADLGPREVLEKYVLVAVLSSHPQLHARPTMDQIVKILETDLPVPSIPERPISLVANLDDIERSVSSSSGSGHLSSSAGYQPFTFENNNPSSDSR